MRNRTVPSSLYRTARSAFVVLALFSQSALAQAVNINTAEVEELDELPGIGEKLAESIVADREENGPFLTVEDLARVPGISSGVLAKLQGRVTTSGGGTSQEPVVIREGEVVSSNVAQKVLSKFAGEPSIREVQKATLDYVEAAPDVIDSWKWRSRTAALLPEFRTRFDYEIDDDQRTRTNNEATEAIVVTSDNDVGYEIQVQGQWDLDRLLFDPQELAVAREGVRLANLRDRVLDEVTRRYYERRRLQVDLELTPPRDLADRIRKELRVQELTADIDSLTGGWFSNKLKAAGRDPY